MDVDFIRAGDVLGSRALIQFNQSATQSSTVFLNFGSTTCSGSLNDGAIMPRAGCIRSLSACGNTTTATSGTATYQIYIDGVLQSSPTVVISSASGTGQKGSYTNVAPHQIKFSAGQSIALELAFSATMAIDDIMALVEVQFYT